MADATTKRILGLLADDQAADVRRSAALILGELGTKDTVVDAALGKLLADADAAVRGQAITAVGKLKIDASLPQLLELVEKGGEDSELAAQAAAKLGTRGTKALQDLMHKVAPGLRRRIAGALGGGGTSSAETAAVDSLLDTDPGVVEAATRALSASVPTLTPSHRQALADHLLDLLRDKKNPLTPVSETAVVRLLAALNDERAEKVLWERTQPPHSADMRAAALQALGKWMSGAAKKGARRAGPAGDQVKRLLACAADADFRVAAPALMMLKEVPVSGAASEWLQLFHAPDSAGRQFAIEKLGDRDRPEIASLLVEQLDFRDGPVREEALSRLGKLKHGQKALVEKLLDADNPDGAWWLARAQSGVVKDFPPALREQVFVRACSYLEKNDRRSDALLFWLREADAETLHERLEEKALALRKKKAYASALNYLRYLTRDPACGVAIRLETAGCGLKTSPKDVNAEARNGDPCLAQFARLLPNYGAEVTTFVDKAKWLDPEDLFYLGFHFAEQNGAPQKFGGHVLHLLLKRSPKSKLAKDARSKLRSAGLD
jgi:HEAT repeat protein